MKNDNLEKSLEFIKEAIHDLELSEKDEETLSLIDSLEDLLVFVEKNRE